MTKLSIQKFKKALSGSYGVQAVIATKCGVTRGAVTRFINKHPNLKPLIEQEKERIIDVAENKLHERILNGDTRALKFFLSTKGKKRGYIPTQEIVETESDQAVAADIEKKLKDLKDLTPEQQKAVRDMLFN